MAVAMERVTGTHVVFGRAGGVWISHVATDPCLLGLTLVCTFSKPKVVTSMLGLIFPCVKPFDRLLGLETHGQSSVNPSF